MKKEFCEFGCNENGCIIDTCQETENGVMGIFRGRQYSYDATCQNNLLFNYQCGNEGRYLMEQTDCGTIGCSNGKCNIDTCEKTDTGVRGIFRGRNYNYDDTCQDNSWFTYSCGNEGHYLMEQENCGSRGCNENGCTLNQQSSTIVGMKKILPKIKEAIIKYESGSKENIKTQELKIDLKKQQKKIKLKLEQVSIAAERTDDIIDNLLKKVEQGNVDAVKQLLILKAKKSKKEQTEVANKLVSALKELEQKQQKLTEQLNGLKTDKSQAGKLSDLNQDLNSVSASRKIITNILRETMQMQEETAETTKSVLDAQGIVQRNISRFEVKKEAPTIASKIKNFFGNIFSVFKTSNNVNISQSTSDEVLGPQCYSPSSVAGGEFCQYQQACARGVCDIVASCVDDENSITVTLNNGNTQTFDHAESGARYFCRVDASSNEYVQYASPCSSPRHTYDGFINYQCSSIGSYCARGSCGDIATCEQNGNTATITLTNGNTQSYLNYYCVGNTLSRIARCQNPFEQQGSYCGTNKFCADSICGDIASCEQINSNTVRLTLESGQQETHYGPYTCVQSNGRFLVKKHSECTSPFGQEIGLCGQMFRDNYYQNQFCAGDICDFLTSCVQNDADSITITTASGFSQSYNGYVCDNARGIRSIDLSRFSCSSLGMEQERNSDGALIESTMCPRGQACAGNRCGAIASCGDNDASITITLENGNTQTVNRPESGPRYFCREDANGQQYLQYSDPCSSPYHTYDGFINHQCSPIGSYCARGNCGTIASCIDGTNDATINLTTGDTQTYLWYRCGSDANGNPVLVRR